MILHTQNRQAIYNFDDISKLFITSVGTTIQIVTKSGAGGEAAKYRTREQTAFVLGMLASAFQAEERVFAFPTETEIEHAKQHGSSGGGRSHGGS